MEFSGYNDPKKVANLINNDVGANRFFQLLNATNHPLRVEYNEDFFESYKSLYGSVRSGHPHRCVVTTIAQCLASPSNTNRTQWPRGIHTHTS